MKDKLQDIKYSNSEYANEKDKLQEAAEKAADKKYHPVSERHRDYKTGFVNGAQYQSEIDKEAIQELVSALEVAKDYLKKDGYKAMPEELELIIQKHKQ